MVTPHIHKFEDVRAEPTAIISSLSLKRSLANQAAVSVRRSDCTSLFDVAREAYSVRQVLNAHMHVHKELF